MSIAKAIEAVQKISGKLVALPESEEYDETAKSYYTALERELRPACFMTPHSANDVAEVVKALKPILDSPSLAIAGAGQQTTPGAANIRDGITIHLRNLQGIEIDQDKKVISVGAGEQMGDVYEKAAAAGLGVAGNRHGGVGWEEKRFEAGLTLLESHNVLTRDRWLILLLVFPRLCMRWYCHLPSCPRQWRNR